MAILIAIHGNEILMMRINLETRNEIYSGVS
jgi:hypothetical protein